MSGVCHENIVDVVDEEKAEKLWELIARWKRTE